MKNSHTVGVERLTREVIRRAGLDVNPGSLAVVERYDDDLVKVCTTSAETRRYRSGWNSAGITTVTAALESIAARVAKSYGATFVGMGDAR